MKAKYDNLISVFSPVREVHPGNVHPVLDELQEDLRGPADGSDGADDAREPHLVGGGVHVEAGEVLDVGGALARHLLARPRIALLEDGIRLPGVISVGHPELETGES